MAKITEETIQRMIQLYEQGNTFANIAKTMGIDMLYHNRLTLGLQIN